MSIAYNLLSDIDEMEKYYMKNKYKYGYEDKDKMIRRIMNENVETILIRTLDIMKISVEDVFEYFFLPKYCYDINHYDYSFQDVLITIRIKKIKENNFLADYQLESVLKYLTQGPICIAVSYGYGFEDWHKSKYFLEESSFGKFKLLKKQPT